MMVAEEYLGVFEQHLTPARQCRPYGILPSEGFFASLPGDLIQGAKCSGTTSASNAGTSSVWRDDEACEAVQRTRPSGDGEAKRSNTHSPKGLQ